MLQPAAPLTQISSQSLACTYFQALMHRCHALGTTSVASTVHRCTHVRMCWMDATAPHIGQPFAILAMQERDLGWQALALPTKQPCVQEQNTSAYIPATIDAHMPGSHTKRSS